ncbi:MAG: peroxiredoxin [Acidobacteriota bacterium]|nr:peroxiredoxin [Acidobacteriota bacterium]
MRPGDLAPDFTLENQDGERVSLSQTLAAGPVVLFFYPAAMTSGCTKETCYFRDLGSEFAAVGAQRVGISMDSVSRQREFASRNALDFTLLADPAGAVAKLYGVKRPLDLFKVKRTTFVIDRDRQILDVIHNELNMNAHADRALTTLKAKGLAN